MITVSVAGKIHLMGEHAVVYGKPALLTAVNVRMYVSIEEVQEEGARRKGKDIEIVSSEPDDYVRKIIDVTKKELRISHLPPFRLTISSQIPARYHLGSSAATAVGVVGAFMYFTKKLWNPTRINEIAYEAEKIQHGSPSGGDNTAVTFGGLLWFRKELEFLKSMWQLPFRPHKRLAHFFLIDTGRPKESTGEMVSYVKRKAERGKRKAEEIFHQNELETKRVTVALKEGNEEELIDAIKKGEKTLEEMGVVSEFVQPVIRRIEKIGGAAKILGGGGREKGVGYLLCYHSEPKVVEACCKDYGFSIKHVTLGEEGVRLEKRE